MISDLLGIKRWTRRKKWNYDHFNKVQNSHARSMPVRLSRARKSQFLCFDSETARLLLHLKKWGSRLLAMLLIM